MRSSALWLSPLDCDSTPSHFNGCSMGASPRSRPFLLYSTGMEPVAANGALQLRKNLRLCAKKQDRSCSSMPPPSCDLCGFPHSELTGQKSSLAADYAPSR